MPFTDDIILSAVQAAVDKAEATVGRVGANINERVGACLIDVNSRAKDLRPHANVVPPVLSQHFENTQRLGNSSVYLHSEMAAILAATKPTGGMGLAVTTPPCPNCAKMLAEAGIAHIFQYNNGLRGDFATQRHKHVKNMTLSYSGRLKILQ